MAKQSKNLFSGDLTKHELELYKELSQKEISIILEYQKKLPILQQDNENFINGRDLYNQLGVKKEYSPWLKQQLEDLECIQKEDFYISWQKESEFFKEYAQYSPQRLSALGYTKEYFINIETAKEISMVAGVKGGRTNKELKLNSKLARKYFIYIEKAFKYRCAWNDDRDKTIIKCKALKRGLTRYRKELVKTEPKWYHNNVYIGEFCLLNEVIIGMSASNYRDLKGLDKKYPIRNTFTEQQLEYVHILEQYDADLIEVQNIMEYSKRKEILAKKFDLMVA